MKKHIAVIASALMMVWMLCGCNARNAVTPSAKPVPTAVASTPSTAPAATPDTREDQHDMDAEKPTPTPLMDTDKMLEDMQEDMDDIVNGEDPLLQNDGDKEMLNGEHEQTIG